MIPLPSWNQERRTVGSIKEGLFVEVKSLKTTKVPIITGKTWTLEKTWLSMGKYSIPLIAMFSPKNTWLVKV
nr:unnamed protein product [Callosobruchus chinensis]